MTGWISFANDPLANKKLRMKNLKTGIEEMIERIATHDKRLMIISTYVIFTHRLQEGFPIQNSGHKNDISQDNGTLESHCCQKNYLSFKRTARFAFKDFL